MNSQSSVRLQTEALHNRTHRSVRRINEALENEHYCSEAFLDISQAFDKVWHTRFLYKLRRSLLLNYFLILKSYLHSRHFLVKVKNEYTELSPVNVSVPQGSVLESLLYLICTADLPTSSESITATFTDDTAVLATDSDPVITSYKLQTNLPVIQNWFKKLKMKANGSKSSHVAFPTPKETYPPPPVHIIKL
jgi:hypothetical protein